MNFFEIMKYFARAIEQMRAVDGILIPQFPWPKYRRSSQKITSTDNTTHQNSSGDTRTFSYSYVARNTVRIKKNGKN